jgi:hypothetical protein
MEEKPISEQESLRLITEMINKAKASHFHEDGTSAILWGSVIGFCGIFSFLQRTMHWDVSFDVWMLTLIAIIPQIWISIRESKRKNVKSFYESSLDAVWVVYALSVFALIFYFNIMPSATRMLMDKEGEALFLQTQGQIKQINTFIPSQMTLLILLYAIPTLTTGISRKFKPMIIGGILCYIIFIISCFTNNTFDYLLNGIAGILNWLIPGLILRNKFYSDNRKALNV